MHITGNMFISNNFISSLVVTTNDNSMGLKVIVMNGLRDLPLKMMLELSWCNILPGLARKRKYYWLRSSSY